MRHRVAGYKIGVNPAHRKAIYRALSIALLTHDQITTTEQKAKAVQPMVEKLITLAKKGDLASRRRVIQKIGNPFLLTEAIDWDDLPEGEEWKFDDINEKIIEGPRVVQKLFNEIGPKYADRQGGYTRIVYLGTNRLGDGADHVVLQLVGDEEGPTVKGRGSRRRQKQNNRTAFAAKLRKGEAVEEVKEEAPAAEVEEETKAAVATEEAPAAEAPATEAPEAAAEESKEENKD